MQLFSSGCSCGESCDCEPGCACESSCACCFEKKEEAVVPDHIYDTYLLAPATQYMYNPMSERNNNKSYASLGKAMLEKAMLSKRNVF
jgi:hypothetical protein